MQNKPFRKKIVPQLSFTIDGVILMNNSVSVQSEKNIFKSILISAIHSKTRFSQNKQTNKQTNKKQLLDAILNLYGGGGRNRRSTLSVKQVSV